MPVAEVPFEIAQIRLAVPAPRPGTAAKAVLTARLRASMAPCVTVVAPAGYGKTTLLARWTEVDPRPFAWVALDGTDGDPLELLRHVATALHRVEPVPAEVFDVLSEAHPATVRAGARAVANAFAARELPMVLILDDLHAVTDGGSLDAIASLVEAVPSGSQIVIAGRQAPALPLARWRVRGLLHEVGVEDLRLDDEEAAALLRAAGVELGPDEVEALNERTEGWPTGLYLAALSLLADGGSAAAFAGDDRYISEYLHREVLSLLPGDSVRRLRRTAVLGRMSGALCDAVLDTTGSAEWLAELERRSCLVVALDRRGEWFRLHRLLGDLLRHELERSEPDLVPALNRRAMAWCITAGHAEAAVAYGEAAGEPDTVAGLLDELAARSYHDGSSDIVDGWLDRAGADELRRYPALAVHGARRRALTGRPAEAERWLAIADGASSDVPLSDGSVSIEPWVAVLRAQMMPAGVEAARADAERALELLPAGSIWRPTAFLGRGVARALLGDPDGATEDLAEAVDLGLAAGASEDVLLAYAQLALIAAGGGAWTEAGRHARAAQALADETDFGARPTSAIAHAASARVALRAGRRDEARECLARAHRLRPQLDHGVPWFSITVGLELARAHLALGEAAAARAVLADTGRVLELRPDMGMLAEEARHLHEQVTAASGPAGAWAMSLTRAELRLLPYLATYLTFPEIAGRLFISRNTVKTEAVSVYRKLGASSRSEAIDRAVEVGLLDRSVSP